MIPWKGARVVGRWLDIGEWIVIGTDGPWLELEPRNETAVRLATIDPDGVLWIRKRDTSHAPSQEETLL